MATIAIGGPTLGVRLRVFIIRNYSSQSFMETGMKEGNVTSDNTGQADTLTDLPVANDQAEETKGAASRTISNLVMADGHDFLK